MARERSVAAHPMWEFGRSLDDAEDLRPTTLMFARVMGWRFDKKGQCWPGRTYFARHGIGQKLMRSALAELEASGRIKIERRKGPRGAHLITWTPDRWEEAREANALERSQADDSADAVEHSEPCDTANVAGRPLNDHETRLSERLAIVSERLEGVQRTPLGRPELENYELSPLPPIEIAGRLQGGGGKDEDVSIVVGALGALCGRTLAGHALTRLANAVRARLASGWTPDDLVAEVRAAPFPSHVVSYEGLLAGRIQSLPDAPLGRLSPALVPPAARCPTCLGIHGGPGCPLDEDWSDD